MNDETVEMTAWNIVPVSLGTWVTLFHFLSLTFAADS